MSGIRSRWWLFLLSPGRVCCLSIARFVPVVRLVLQSNQVCMLIFNAYGALLCALTERKTERELARARISVVSSQQLEKFVQQRLMSFLTSNMLLPDSQFAYWRNHSTEDAITLAVNRWLLAKHERQTTGIVFVDMSKSLDRVRHDLLVSVGSHWCSWYCTVLVLWLSVRQATACTYWRRPLRLCHLLARGIPRKGIGTPAVRSLHSKLVRVSSISSLKPWVCGRHNAGSHT